MMRATQTIPTLRMGLARYTAMAGALATVGLLVGCASTMGRWEAQQGDAVRNARAAQVIDPDAPTRNGTRAPTLDAKSAIVSQDRYVDSFKDPPPQNIFVIGAPTTGGGGK